MWRGCCRSFSAPPAPAGLPVLGVMRALLTPNSCAPPFRGLRIEFYTAQTLLGGISVLFHLPSGPLRAAVHKQLLRTTASISESGSNGSGSCREAVKEVEKL